MTKLKLYLNNFLNFDYITISITRNIKSMCNDISKQNINSDRIISLTVY